MLGRVLYEAWRAQLRSRDRAQPLPWADLTVDAQQFWLDVAAGYESAR